MPLENLADRLPEPLVQLLQLGGPVAVILLLMSVYGLTIALVKLWQFRLLRLGQTDFVDTVIITLQRGDEPAARAELKRSPNPIARTMWTAIEARRRWPRHENLVREEVTRVGIEQLASLRSHLRSLELIAGLSPLLGLLGTVLGMIEAFRQLEGAGSRVDPSLLSGGIWEALVTTAIGLAVAIPALAVYTILEQRVERLRVEMESATTRVFTQSLDPGIGHDKSGPYL